MVTANPMDFEKLKGWESLSTIEKTTVKKEHNALSTTVERLGKDWIEVGARLKALRDVMEPHRMFDAYLKMAPFGFKRATAYRRIRNAEKARRSLTPDLFRYALMSGLDNVNIDAVKVIPPPKSNNPKEMHAYLKQVSGKETVAHNPEVMQKECANFVRSRWEKLPAEWSHKKKSDWMRTHCGICMGFIGVSGEQKVIAEAIPIDWVRGSQTRKAS